MTISSVIRITWMTKTMPRSAIQITKTTASAIIHGMINPKMNRNISTLSMTPDCPQAIRLTFSFLSQSMIVSSANLGNFTITLCEESLWHLCEGDHLLLQIQHISNPHLHLMQSHPLLFQIQYRHYGQRLKPNICCITAISLETHSPLCTFPRQFRQNYFLQSLQQQQFILYTILPSHFSQGHTLKFASCCFCTDILNFLYLVCNYCGRFLKQGESKLREALHPFFGQMISSQVLILILMQMLMHVWQKWECPQLVKHWISDFSKSLVQISQVKWKYSLSNQMTRRQQCPQADCVFPDSSYQHL